MPVQRANQPQSKASTTIDPLTTCSKSELARMKRRRKNVKKKVISFAACVAKQHSLLKQSIERESILKPYVDSMSPCISKYLPTFLPAAKASYLSDATLGTNAWSPLCDRSRGHKKIDCAEQILLREKYLLDIRRRSTKLDRVFGELSCCPEMISVPQKSKLWRLLEASINEVLSLVERIRSVSLHVVQMALEWHLARQMSHVYPTGLAYAGQNYLIKMISDLTFLGDSPTMQYYVGHRASMANSLLLPASNTASNEAYLKASDQVSLESKRAMLG